ncbi:MAG: type II secretion system F family protein [Gammaproteobacteria bacterium]
MRTNSTYHYQAMDKKGIIIKGCILAKNVSAAQEILRKQALLPLKIQKKYYSFLWDILKRAFIFSKTSPKWTSQSLIFFTQQLSHLIISGTPLDEALACIAHTREGDIIKILQEQIVEGTSLHEAMALFPKNFPTSYRAIVAAGEQSGDLGSVLQQLQTHYEDKQIFKQKMIQALLYPLTIALVGFLTTLFLMLHVVPTLLTIVETAHEQLPFSTVLLLKISHWTSHYGSFTIFSLLLFSLCLFTIYKKNKQVHDYCHRALLKLPILGHYLLTINLILYLKTLSISLKAGNALLTSLSLSNDILTLAPLKKSFSVSQQQIQEGYSIHQSWEKLPYFSKMNLQLLAIGEQSGHLTQTLDNISHWEYQQLQKRLKYFITLFEPIVVLCIGAVVLWLVIAILLPIFNLEQM